MTRWASPGAEPRTGHIQKTRNGAAELLSFLAKPVSCCSRWWGPQWRAPILSSWSRRDRISAISSRITVSAKRRRLGLDFDVHPHNPIIDDPERFAECCCDLCGEGSSWPSISGKFTALRLGVCSAGSHITFRLHGRRPTFRNSNLSSESGSVASTMHWPTTFQRMSKRLAGLFAGRSAGPATSRSCSERSHDMQISTYESSIHKCERSK